MCCWDSETLNLLTRQCFSNVHVFCNSIIASWTSTHSLSQTCYFQKLYMLKRSRRAQVVLEIDFKVDSNSKITLIINLACYPLSILVKNTQT